ncbi:nucleotide kinase [Bacillus phage DLc1]|uniref:Uncharacterized protein n=1 Tax=Bacillus phage DLc1 TaxID=2777318 RepID=A0A7M1RQ55_9CAUD|nr:nucleotide kinase [Bacillus phage DLc1]QOR56254.1 hypothetical protein [Bacillus phage DLc1]
MEVLKRGSCNMCYLDTKINRAGICFPCHESLRKEDIINKPNHYHGDGVDPISIGETILTKEEMQGFYKMNMIKYWYRAGKKDGNSKEQDLKKYEFYKNKMENM